jgi:hypothetical protein
MKKQIMGFVLTIAALTALFTLSSSSSGPGGNRTGAPGSSGDCSGCHGSAVDPTANVTLTIFDGGTPVTSYEPNKTYDVKLIAAGNSTKMGFQMSFINDKNSVAGNLSTQSGNGTEVYTSGNQQIWGHTSPGIGTVNNTWTAKWTAPASSTGEVRIFSALVLSNSNGSNGGDYFHKFTTTIGEAQANQNASISKNQNAIIENPVSNTLNFRNPIKQGFIWDAKGQFVQKIELLQSHSVSDLPAGVYHVNFVNTDGSTGASRFIKN